MGTAEEQSTHRSADIAVSENCADIPARSSSSVDCRANTAIQAVHSRTTELF